jgi:hypothetical protein
LDIEKAYDHVNWDFLLGFGLYAVVYTTVYMLLSKTTPF